MYNAPSIFLRTQCSSLYKACLPALFLFFISPVLFSQQPGVITGKITGEADNKPLPNCSVFINNTSKGTESNTAGAFKLVNLPLSGFDLVISCIGYETVVFHYKAGQQLLPLDVKLKSKDQEMISVVIEPYDKDGWEKWGKLFTDNFIGVGDNARNCQIKNKDALRFRFSDKTNRLSVTSNDPLIIENETLGYTIKYQLEKFSVDFTKNITSYFGYPLFQQMTAGSNRRKRIWEANRKTAYLGSMAHFIRSLVASDLSKAGFEVIRTGSIRNREKDRVKDLYRKNIHAADSIPLTDESLLKMDMGGIFSKDSLVYYRSVLAKHDFYSGPIQLNADSLVYVNKNGARLLFFKDHLVVLYTNTKEGRRDQSEFYLLTPAPVLVEKDGVYSPPQEIMTLGFWAKHEKIANELPSDYEDGTLY